MINSHHTFYNLYDAKDCSPIRLEELVFTYVCR